MCSFMFPESASTEGLRSEGGPHMFSILRMDESKKRPCMVEHAKFAHCLDCFRQTSKFRGTFKYHSLPSGAGVPAPKDEKKEMLFCTRCNDHCRQDRPVAKKGRKETKKMVCIVQSQHKIVYI
eukprot:191529-Amphidinium_carterae.1